MLQYLHKSKCGKGRNVPELWEGTTTSRVMQSPIWTTWVNAQTSAVLGISLEAFTATITFWTSSEPLSCFPRFCSRLITTLFRRNFNTLESQFSRPKKQISPMLLKDMAEDQTQKHVHYWSVPQCWIQVMFTTDMLTIQAS